MTYSKFIYEAEQKTIKQLDNGTWYLDPEWKDIICREVEKDLDLIEDSYLNDWWDFENVLQLEVDRRNAQDDKKKDVINWLYDLIHTTVEPAVLAEETEYLKNLIEFRKYSNENNESLEKA